MIGVSCRLQRMGWTAFAALGICMGTVHAQPPASSCAPPLCVNRADDDAGAPAPGMLRYAIGSATDGAVITFDPALNGQTIKLDRSSPANHLKVLRNLSIQGPGSNLLTIDGGNATRIFFVAADNVQISGLTLANGAARGGDGAAATGGAGGGGGAAGMGGAIFVSRGSLTLNGVVVSGSRSAGGNGGAGGASFGPGRGGSGGGFGRVVRGIPGGGDLESAGAVPEGAGGVGGAGDRSAEAGGEGGWAGGGGGGGFALHGSGGRGAPGGPSGFAGGVGGAGAFLDSDGEGSATPAGGGCGGSALGGAIFVRSGQLHLRDTSFVNNSVAGGIGAAGAPNGVAKGGALFICSSSFCGPGHDGVAIVFGNTSFKGSSAAQAAEDPACTGRDDADVCGPFIVAPAGNNPSH